MFSNTHWLKQFTWSRPDSRAGKIDFTFWWELLQSHIAKGGSACREERHYRGHFCKESTTPMLPFEIGLHARTLLCIWLAVLQAKLDSLFSVFSWGKMKWFGGNQGKDVKFLKLPEGIFFNCISISLQEQNHTHMYIWYICIFTH